jgi:hypothetical protein
MLKTSPRFVAQLVARDAIPYQRITTSGRLRAYRADNLRFSRTEVQRWVQQGEGPRETIRGPEGGMRAPRNTIPRGSAGFRLYAPGLVLAAIGVALVIVGNAVVGAILTAIALVGLGVTAYRWGRRHGRPSSG